MSRLPNRRIVLGVAGGIAAYKAADLVRRLRDRNFEVRVVMTAAAREFVAPLTFQALSSNPVHCDLLDEQAEAGMGHIELARWADLVLIAPATANVLARLAHGFADDLLTTLCLATTAPVVVAPAMNQQMWQAGATRTNVLALLERGVAMLGPGEGDQACGEVGPGRMLEPDERSRPGSRPGSAVARSRESRSSSPPAPPARPSIRCATSPTTAPERWDTRSQSRRRRRAPGYRW